MISECYLGVAGDLIVPGLSQGARMPELERARESPAVEAD